MKKAILSLLLLLASPSLMAQLPKPYAKPNTKPLIITDVVKSERFAQKQFDNKADSIDYHRFSINEHTYFHRCLSDTQLVGYVLVPTEFDSVFMEDRINGYGNSMIGRGKTRHNFGYGRFKKDVTIEDVQLAENALAACVNDQYDFSSIRKHYRQYGRQYIFFYNENDELCVLVNCSCEKYDWLFSHRYTSVRDGGDCFWKMIINLHSGKCLSVMVNGEA